MADLKCFGVCDLVHTLSAHLSHITPSSTQTLTVTSISILRMVCLAVGLCSAHDAGEDTNENDAECREARTDDTHIHLDIYHSISNDIANLGPADLLDQFTTST